MNLTLIEFYILILASRKETFLLKVGEYLGTNDYKEVTKKSYFENRHCQTLFNLLYYIFNKTRKLPSYKDLEFLVTSLFQSDNQKMNDIIGIAKDVYSFNEDINFAIVEEEALKFVKDKMFLDALQNSAKDIEEKNYDAVRDRINKATNVSFDSDFGFSIKDPEDVKTAIASLADSQDVFATGYDMLDSEQVLNGGFRRKEFNVVAANSGIGKTLFMNNLAVNLAISGFKVEYISLETSAARLIARILANVLDLPTANITYTVSEEKAIQDSWKEKIASIKGELRIKEFASGSMSCNNIEAFLLDQKKNTGFEPDILFIDYLSICKPNDKKLSKENSYTYDGTIAVDMRELAYRLNCCVVTGAQLNRESLKDGATKTIISTENLANSLGIEFSSDFILTLSRDKTCQKNKQLMAYVAKNRNNDKGQVMTLSITNTCRLVEEKKGK